MSELFSALELPLFQRALLAGVLVSAISGVIGSFITVKRTSSISGGLSHAAFGGIGLGYFLGFDPSLGAAIFCVISAIALGLVYRYYRGGLDNVITMLWSLGMAVGMIFIALAPGTAPDLSSYLFGSILFVPDAYLLFALALDCLVLGSVAYLFHPLLAVCFDEEFAEVCGLKVTRLFIFLLVLTALTIAVFIRIGGVILTITILTTPAVIARQWCESLVKMFLVSASLSALSITLGLFASYWLSLQFSLELPVGPVIIVLLSALYLLSTLASRRAMP